MNYLFIPEEWTGSFTEPAPVVRHPLGTQTLDVQQYRDTTDR